MSLKSYDISSFQTWKTWCLDCSEHSFRWKLEEEQDISSLLRNGQRATLLSAELGRCGDSLGSGDYWPEDEAASLCSNSQDSIPVAGGPEVWTSAMEGSVLSPTSWERRRAWLRQSRHWQTQVLEEEAAAALQGVPDPEPSGLDDVFQEGKRPLDIKQTCTFSCDMENVPDAQVCSAGSGSWV